MSLPLHTRSSFFQTALISARIVKRFADYQKESTCLISFERPCSGRPLFFKEIRDLKIYLANLLGIQFDHLPVIGNQSVHLHLHVGGLRVHSR